MHSLSEQFLKERLEPIGEVKVEKDGIWWGGEVTFPANFK